HNRLGNPTSAQRLTDIGALAGGHPAGKRSLAHTRFFGQGRLRSWSDHSGIHQPAVRRLRTTKSSHAAVDSGAYGVATDRHRSRAAYRLPGQIAGRVNEAVSPRQNVKCGRANL